MDNKNVQDLSHHLKRIFSFPITRSSFRQLQNALLAATEGNVENANALLNSLLSGSLTPEAKSYVKSTDFQDFIDQFTIQANVAREVFERGEFINLLTSDFVHHPHGGVLFANHIRRIDGQEFQFMTDMESTIQLVNHFINRIQELDKSDPSKNYLNGFTKELDSLKNKIDRLITAQKS